MHTNPRDLLVIGGGLIGLSAALEAQARGFQVTVLDRDGIGTGASAGNAGAFAFTDIFPLASPGIMRKAPYWLLDPLGPLSIPPRYALKIAPWMWRFWRACSASRARTGTVAQTALMDLSRATLRPFLDRAGLTQMLRQDGQLQLYESQAEFKASLPTWQARAAHGIPFEHMTGTSAIAARQPGLSDRFTAATFTPEWYSISDPGDYTRALADVLMARGGKVQRGEVARLSTGPDQVTAHLSDGTQITASHVLLSAGAWSHHLARDLGDRIPLETERGYNTTLPAASFDLKCQLTFGGHGFVVTRLTNAVRIGGAVELGGLHLPPNYKRADAMLAKAKRFMPGLVTTGGAQWMGFRPSLPDSLPVIGRATRAPRVLYAFGHGHLGLTQSTGTAKIIGDLLLDTAPSVDLTAFSPTRF